MRNEMRSEMWEHIGNVYDIAMKELKGENKSKEEELEYIQKRLKDAGITFTIEEVKDMYEN